MDLKTAQSWFDSRTLLLSRLPRLALTITQPAIEGVPDPLHREQSGRSVRLNLHLPIRLRGMHRDSFNFVLLLLSYIIYLMTPFELNYVAGCASTWS